MPLGNYCRQGRHDQPGLSYEVRKTRPYMYMMYLTAKANCSIETHEEKRYTPLLKSSFNCGRATLDTVTHHEWQARLGKEL